MRLLDSQAGITPIDPLDMQITTAIALTTDDGGSAGTGRNLASGGDIGSLPMIEEETA